MATYAVNVSRIHSSMENREVKQMFEDIGPVNNIHLAVSAKKSYKTGIVFFIRLHDAVEAIIRFDKANTCIGSKLKVEPGDTKVSDQLKTRIRELENTSPPAFDNEGIENQTLIIIQNLNDNIDENFLEDLFLRFGKIDGVSIKRENSKSKGYGYVDFANHVSALRAVRQMNGRNIDGKQLQVAFVEDKETRKKKLQAQKGELIKDKKNQTLLIVRNFKDLIDEEKLRNMFNKFGEVKSVSIKRHEHNGRSKGFGFVDFDLHASAEYAIQSMNGWLLEGGRQLQVAFVEPKEVRELKNPSSREKLDEF